jgi:hypothetical protein
MGVEIVGLEDVLQRLDQLPGLIVAHAFAEALDRAGGVIAAEVEVRIPEGETEGLLEHIVVNVEIDPSLRGGSVAVGFSHAQAENGRPYDAIADWVERGHIMLSHDKKPTKLEHVPRHPFMAPAFDASAQKAIEVFTQTILDYLDSQGA